MALMTGNEYIESLRAMDLRVYMFGKRVEDPVDDPILRPSVNSVKMTYDLAQGPNYADLMTTTSHLTGETTNRFMNIHQSTDDLVKKVKMQRELHLPGTPVHDLGHDDEDQQEGHPALLLEDLRAV